MRALVTGGGGFLGRAILESLITRGVHVRSFSRNYHKSLASLRIEQCQGDLADLAAVGRACEKTDIVFHVGAKAGIWGDPDEFYRTNVLGTENVIKACHENGISRLVYTSSPSVIFDGRDMEGVDESVAYPSKYKASYPRTKAAAEQLILAANDHLLATVALRPHLVWGPRDNHLIPGILQRARKRALWRVGPGNKLVDLTYIDNAADAHLCAGDRLHPGSAIAGQVYFISQGEPMPIWDFVNRVLECGGYPPVQRSIPTSMAYAAGFLLEYVYGGLGLKTDPRMTRFLVEELSTAHWFDIAAARRDLGYTPKVSMEEGFGRLCTWLRGTREYSRPPSPRT